MIISDPVTAFNVLESRQKYERLFLFYRHGQYFVFRPLLVGECETITSLGEIIDANLLDEWIVSKAIVTNNIDYLLNEAPAGLASSISSFLLKASTPTSSEEISRCLEKEREAISNTNNIIDYMLKAGAGTVLPNSKSITYKQQIQYIIFAEQVLGKKLELLDPSKLPKDKDGKIKKLSPRAMSILSKEAADKPDFTKDNAALNNL